MIPKTYLYAVIVVLLFMLHSIKNNEKKGMTKIYWFHKPKCKYCKEMEGEWKKVETKICNKYNVKKIDLSLPENAKMKKNFEIKTVPQIVKITSDGCRYFYEGERKAKDILEWVYE